LLEPYVKRCLKNNINYRTEAFVIRLTDKTPIRVYPEDLSPNFDVYANGSSELQNKQLRISGLLKAWEIDIAAAQLESMLYGQPLTKFYELKKEIHANLGISTPDTFLINPQELNQQQMPILPPEAEFIALKRMAEGIVPVMPIMIQPGEDYRDHYEKHLAVMASEEFQALPDLLKRVWTVHIMSYDKVLKLLDRKKYEEKKEDEVKSKEVAVSQ